MTGHTDQDVAMLYCGMRDGICEARALTWRQRLMDFLFPERAAARRLAAIEAVYRKWQAARTEQPTEDAPIPLRMNDGTLLARQMVAAQMKKLRDEALPRA